MKIATVGAGYVGLVTGACFAKLGNRVVLSDIDEARISLLKQGKSPIYEPGLDELLRSPNISATTDLRTAVEGSDIIFICVATQSKGTDGNVDLSQVYKATSDLATLVSKGQTIVVKSTVPPGTAENLVLPALAKDGKRVGVDFEIGANPEFLREGCAIHDFLHPDRVVIGERLPANGPSSLVKLYEPFEAPVLRVSLKTAEMIKYASNVFLAAKVSLVNELGNICKSMGIDMFDVAAGMGYDKRIGSSFLLPGAGYGGSCFPKDLRGLISVARTAGYEPELLGSVQHVNEAQPLRLVNLLKKHLPALSGKTIGILGLAFKPNTDDVREAVALKVVDELAKEGASVVAHDPMAAPNFKKLRPTISYGSPDEVLGCDAIIILTEWPEYNELNYRGKIVIDGRRIEAARRARVYEGVCW